MKIELSAQLPQEVSLAYTEFQFKNNSYSPELWENLLDPLIERISQQDTLEDIRNDLTIQVTKQAYKSLGKDPSRFRPSSDSLWRRVAKGKGLYQVNTLVDLNNYLSLKYHLPFGSYDLDKVQAPIILTKGQPRQEYSGIGKKTINLENLLILKDAQGPFGSPTSDSTRAMIEEKTTHALLVGYVFGQNAEELEKLQVDVNQLITHYLASAHIIDQQISRQE